MTAAVTPLEARCEVCKDTGSKSQDLTGYLDCFACDIADQRVKFREQMGAIGENIWGGATDALAWRAYQLGKASACAQPELTVWCGPMPESNGKSNFTATLKRKDARPFDTNSYTFQRSEYPDRVRYEADCMRYLIGEIDTKPDILAYDADKHSGYAAPMVPVAAQPVVQVPHDEHDSFITAYRLWQAKEAPNAHPEMVHYMSESHWKRAAGAMWRARAALAAPSLEAQPAGEVIPAEKLCALLPGTYYMDPPDGGSVTVLEQVERMAKDAARLAWLVENARTGSVGFGDWWINGDEPAEEWRAAIDAAMAQGEKQ